MAGRLMGRTTASEAVNRGSSPRPPAQEFWLLRLRDEKLSWHSYRDEATREKWAAKYRSRGDRVSFDGMIRG